MNNGLSGGFGGVGLGDAGGTGLASQAAQMGFARGAQMQEQQAHENAGTNVAGKDTRFRIRDVWASNLRQEMATLRSLVDRYPYIGIVSLHATRKL